LYELKEDLSVSDLNFKKATIEDLPIIVKMLVDDDLGSTREHILNSLDDAYLAAFNKISKDQNSELVVATIDEKAIGVLQITFITYLTYKGGTRALIEGVRVDSSLRGRGLGRKMIEYAILMAKEKDCHMVQLTTNKSRKDALRFYESMGFINSHEGMKFFLK
jgi:ribosomal protein S18 acetylase RimI-like enzyme